MLTEQQYEMCINEHVSLSTVLLQVHIVRTHHLGGSALNNTQTNRKLVKDGIFKKKTVDHAKIIVKFIAFEIICCVKICGRRDLIYLNWIIVGRAMKRT